MGSKKQLKDTLITDQTISYDDLNQRLEFLEKRIKKVAKNRSNSKIDESCKIKRSKSCDKTLNLLDCTKKTIQTKKNRSKMYTSLDNFSLNRTTENSVELFK